MKKIIVLSIIMLLTAGFAFALPIFPENQGTERAQLPESRLTKVVFIRYAPGKEPICDNGICEPRENWKNCPEDCPKEETTTTVPPTNPCYDFLSGSKPKWNWVEDYYYEQGLEASSEWATSTWDAVTSATIFGNGVSGDYDWGKYDFKNSISYGNYGNPDVIAVTAIWYRGKDIYEYDIMFDTDYFPRETDLDTVALHEFGHAAGLDDLYDAVCDSEVMYGYYVGIKTELGEGDRAGILELYGA